MQTVVITLCNYFKEVRVERGGGMQDYFTWSADVECQFDIFGCQMGEII